MLAEPLREAGIEKGDDLALLVIGLRREVGQLIGVSSEVIKLLRRIDGDAAHIFPPRRAHGAGQLELGKDHFLACG